ncbi:tripartite tricarboxylate transporter permease [Crenalkalicoccus roseus]|uniref:tripartite tricarboxylate transporter permease n=1 Tax=Crenalkalicoccus roseus TaxID=1485588 RepID=UPI001081BDE7|nr:tripartite tricarboxylate transporter permease [Crenalkalicoccus roseus]
MLDLPALGAAASLLGSSWSPWLVVPPGLLIGLVFGAIPGLSVPIAMAVILPLTLYLDFLSAILLLTSIFTGGGFGAAIPAILMNVPGSSSAVATTFDGHPMARQGRHSYALGLALAASCVGSAAGYVILLLVISWIADAVLRLGPLEMFAIAVWGLTLIAVLNEGSVAKGLLAGLLGVMMGMIGMSAQGDMRGTFDMLALVDGIPKVPALIGLFAASEMFRLMRSEYIVADASLRRPEFGQILDGARDAFRHPGVLLRGSLIGIGVGAIPGVGAAVANLLSYAETKRRSADPSAFGKGEPRGVAASESANSSSEGGSMATLLALGIPGGSATAVMLGAFAMHNVTGGPRFIAENMDLVYAVILGNLVQVVLLAGLGLGFLFVAASLVRVPVRFLVPGVLFVALMGCFSITGDMMGPITMVACAALGFWLREHGFPVAAVVIGLLLGPAVEAELLRSIQISGGDPAFLLTRPIAIVILLLLAASLCYPLLRRRSRVRSPAADAVG